MGATPKTLPADFFDAEENKPKTLPADFFDAESSGGSTAPIPNVVAPTVKPTSTPARDFSRAISLPGVTSAENTAWEKTKEFVQAPIASGVSVDAGDTPHNRGLDARLRAARGYGVSQEQATLPLPAPTQTLGDIANAKGGGIIGGVGRGALRTGLGLTSPMNLTMLTGMGRLPKLANAGVNAAFTVEQAMQIPDQVRAIKSTYDDPNATSGDVAQAVTEFGGSTVLGALGAGGMVKDIRTSPQMQRRMAPRIASDFTAASDIAYNLGGNRKTRSEARGMFDLATEGTQQRLDKFGIVPRPLPSPQGGVVVAAPNRPPLAQQLAEGNERVTQLRNEIDQFANPPKPVYPSRDLPPRTPKSAADSAAVFQEPTILEQALEQPVGPAPFRKPVPGMPLPRVTDGLPPVRLTDDGAIVDPTRQPTQIRRSAGPDTYPIRPLPQPRPLPAESPLAPPPQAEAVQPLPPPPAAKPVDKKPDHEFASTQVNLPENVASRVRQTAAKIMDSDLAEDGRENEVHATVKFGLHGNDPNEVRNVLAGEPPVRVKLGKVSLFENKDADVVKIGVDSPDLHRLNKKIADALPNTDTHPTYQPHVTLAYVKPGQGKKYLALNDMEGTEITLDSLTFSGKDRTKFEIPLTGRSALDPVPAPGPRKEVVHPAPVESAAPVAAASSPIDRFHAAYAKLTGEGYGKAITLADVQQEMGITDPAEFTRLLADLDRGPGITSDGAKLARQAGGTWQDAGKLRIRTEDLSVDPIRFQYKVEGIGQGGVTNELKDIGGWDDDAAGTIFVWKDPSNGKTYVVNGHHRYDLARRLGQPDVGIKYIDAPDAQAARAAGALQNIREGKGSAIDAAKFLRDTGKTIADLKAANITVKGQVAKDGAALANLAPSLFDDVVHGNLKQDRAAIIGEGLDNYDDQKAVLKLADQKKATNAEMKEMIRLALAEKEELAKSRKESKDQSSVKEDEYDLFGNKIGEEPRTTIYEKSQLSTYILKRLSEEKRIFGLTGTKAAADRLGAAGNKIEAEVNREIADQAKQVEEAYNRLSGMSGPISKLLREGAERIANGEKPDAVKESIYGSVRDEVATLLKSKPAAAVRKADAGSVESGDRSVQENPRQRTVVKTKDGLQESIVSDIEARESQIAAKNDRNRPLAEVPFSLVQQEAPLPTGPDPRQSSMFDAPKAPVVRDPGEAGFLNLSGRPVKQLSPSELYALEMSEKREAARRAMNGGTGSIGQRAWAIGKHFTEDAKANVVDKAAPIEDPPDRAIRADKSTFSIPPAKELEGAISKVFRAKAIAGMFAKDHGLIEAIQSPATAQDYTNFEQLLIARHAAELDPTIATGRDAAKDAQLVKDLTPKYQKELAAVENHVRKLEDYMVSSGLKSQKEIDTLRKRYPNYTDFHRVLPESLAGFTAPRGIASKLSTNIIQKLKGSEDLQIDDPLGNLMKKTDRVITEGLVNQAARAAAEQRHFPGLEKLIREVSPQTAKKMRAEDYFTYLEDGKPKYFVAPRQFVSAAKNLDEKSIGLLGQVFYSLVRIHKAGTTAWDLAFGGINFLKDQQTRAINQTGVSKRAQHVTLANQSVASKAGDLVGLHPTIAKATVQSVLQVAKNYIGNNSVLYDEMVRSGGGGTSFDMFRNDPSTSVKHIRAQKNLKSRTKNILTGGFREFENLIGMTEQMTRLQAFGATKADALAVGMGQADALALAAKASRQVTADFYRGGNWRRAMMAMYPYINANIQGTRESIRSAKADPVGYAIRTATNVAIPMAIATMWNTATPEREKAYNDIQDWEKDKYFIVLPENPTQDEKGRWITTKLPMPPGISEVGGLVRRHMETAKGGDPVNWKNYAAAMFNYLSPVSGSGDQIAGQSVPHGPKIMAEVAFNKNFYTGKEINPDWMQNLPVKDQAYDSTSGTARMMGDSLGVAPVYVDHALKGLGGGVTSQALHYTDVGRKAIADRLPDSAPGVQYLRDIPIGGESLSEKVGRRLFRSQGGRTSDKQIEETKKAAALVSEEQGPEKKLVRELYKAWKTDPDAARDKIREAVSTNKINEDGVKDLVKMIKSDDMEKWERDLIRQSIQTRAVAIATMLEGKSSDERREIAVRLKEKGVLTVKVLEAMKARTTGPSKP